jgi:methylated-DNA-[protein]-cysteine S-methyltransferase
MAFYIRGIKSIIGNLTLVADDNALLEIQFKSTPNNKNHDRDRSKILDLTQKELDLYFQGKLKKFTVPQKPKGTDYQQKCWKVLQLIKYGKTISYKDQAIKVANANHTRAVAGANNKNPLPIIIPCHRVIGSDRSLTGYAGGLKVKQMLLDIEQDRH